MSLDPDQPVVVEEFAELRRCLDVGAATIDGRLALLAQRIDQADNDVNGLTARVAALEHSRWPIPTVAAVAAAGSLGVTLWQALGR
ncbi:hypothetical protein ABCR94_20610 [Streptomyces sp. 21So2-11]|uniref:hypothetical protein n=1 Tax=Streptomyces sp. 21So2-11 TaxID=3144408 RepID=UPI00321C1B50